LLLPVSFSIFLAFCRTLVPFYSAPLSQFFILCSLLVSLGFFPYFLDFCGFYCPRFIFCWFLFHVFTILVSSFQTMPHVR
jgi:hypothetical protein